MSRTVSDCWERLYAEFLHLVDESTGFRAAVKLGEIWNCLQDSMSSQAAKERWRSRIDEARSSIEKQECIQSELDERVHKLHRIVSAGTKFVYEEIVVIISERIQIDLVLGLPSIGLKVNHSMLERIDDDITTLSSALVNQSAYSAAKKSVRKNWGNPIRHTLLG